MLQASLFFLHFTLSPFSKYITRSYCLLTVKFLQFILLNHKEISATIPSREVNNKYLPVLEFQKLCIYDVGVHICPQGGVVAADLTHHCVIQAVEFLQQVQLLSVVTYTKIAVLVAIQYDYVHIMYCRRLLIMCEQRGSVVTYFFFCRQSYLVTGKPSSCSPEV